MPDATPPDSSSPDLRAAIGHRIRTLRTRRDIPLSALAAATHLGKGTLSELERGQRNPTLDTLFAIATALSVPLSDLLATTPDSGVGARVSAGDGAGVSAGDGARVSAGPTAHGQNVDAELLGRWEDGAEIVETYRMTIGAGRRQSQPHAVGVLESITVISGTVVVGTHDTPTQLSNGQSHTFAGDTEHFYEGITARSSTVLVMRYPT